MGQQAGDLLGCAWPAPLAAAARPLESVTWLAAMAVITDRCCGDPRRLREMGYEKFLATIRRELPRWGGKYARHCIVRGLRAPLTDTGGVAARRRCPVSFPPSGGTSPQARRALSSPKTMGSPAAPCTKLDCALPGPAPHGSREIRLRLRRDARRGRTPHRRDRTNADHANQARPMTRPAMSPCRPRSPTSQITTRSLSPGSGRRPLWPGKKRNLPLRA